MDILVTICMGFCVIAAFVAIAIIFNLFLVLGMKVFFFFLEKTGLDKGLY